MLNVLACCQAAADSIFFIISLQFSGNDDRDWLPNSFGFLTPLGLCCRVTASTMHLCLAIPPSSLAPRY